MRITAKWALVTLALVLVLGLAAAIPRLSRPGLAAQVVVRAEDIGIPGITKTYEAKVTNRGFLPVRVARCDFIDDSMSPGTMVAYAVQRWNESRRQWDTVFQYGKSQFCKPYPLGIVKAKLANRWLWPGESLSTGEEATAARDGFAIGDQARFVVFLGTAWNYDSSIATTTFRIDEHQQTHTALRVRH
jgi:hypothetical protein